MKNQLPISLRLDLAAEKQLEDQAQRSGLKKATLAQILLESAIAAVAGQRKLGLPVKLKLLK